MRSTYRQEKKKSTSWYSAPENTITYNLISGNYKTHTKSKV